MGKIHHHCLKRQGSSIDLCVGNDLKVEINMVCDCGFDRINGKIQFCTYILSKAKHCAVHIFWLSNNILVISKSSEQEDILKNYTFVQFSSPVRPPVFHTNQLRTASSGTGLLSMFRLCSLQLHTMTGVLYFVQNLSVWQLLVVFYDDSYKCYL